MKTIECGVELNFPVREVYNQWTQFETYPLFMSGVKEVRQIDDKNLYWLVKVAGVERGFQARIVEQIPDQRIAWESTSGPDHFGIVVFSALETGGTQVRVHLTWDPDGIVEKIGAAIRFDDAEVQSSLDEFKRLMNENGFATGAWRGRIGATHTHLNDGHASREAGHLASQLEDSTLSAARATEQAQAGMDEIDQPLHDDVRGKDA